MKIAIVVINRDGEGIARKIRQYLGRADIYNLAEKKQKGKCNIAVITREIFDKKKYAGLVYIAATGIVVRSIAPYIKNKYEDPAVVGVDTAGRQAISLLSGHEGGANRLTFRVAAAIDAQPVITTGTEVHRRFIIGIGCRKGIGEKNITAAIRKIVTKNNIKHEDVRLIATIEIKKREKGLIKACDKLDLPLVFITKEQIKRFSGHYSGSQAAERHLGVRGVCEPCALLAGRRTLLIVPKQVIDGVTIAVAKEN